MDNAAPPTCPRCSGAGTISVDRQVPTRTNGITETVTISCPSQQYH